MPRQFVSICGHSGVGKKTLIDKLWRNPQPELMERFRITEPVGAYGLYTDMQDPKLMPKATKQTVLHFWQDATQHWVTDLRNMFPNDTHRVILLWCPWDIHARALEERQNGYAPGPEGVRKNWFDERVPQFRKLEAKGFKIELIHGRTYEPCEWPRCEIGIAR